MTEPASNRTQRFSVSAPPISWITPDLFFETVLPFLEWDDLWVISRVRQLGRHWRFTQDYCHVSTDQEIDPFRLHYQNHCLECHVMGMHGGKSCKGCHGYFAEDNMAYCRAHGGRCDKRYCRDCTPQYLCQCVLDDRRNIRNYCIDCHETWACEMSPPRTMSRCLCGKQICTFCPTSGGYCESCCKNFCSSCESLSKCHCCSLVVCWECTSSEICRYCEENICNECIAEDISPCGTCGQYVCDECGHFDPRECAACDEALCFECESAQCEDCDYALCAWCANGGNSATAKSLRKCACCSCRICEGCRSVSTCDVCKHGFCEPCDPLRSCCNCSKKYCNQCASNSTCAACRDPLCNDCSSATTLYYLACVACKKVF
jgi:hypothetical protein